LKEKGVNFKTTITDSKISSEVEKFIKTENSSKAKVTTSSGYKTKFNNNDCIEVLNDSTNDSTNHSLQSFGDSDDEESHSFDSQSQQRQENDSQTTRRSKRALEKMGKELESCHFEEKEKILRSRYRSKQECFQREYKF